jgi:hypothetical protein
MMLKQGGVRRNWKRRWFVLKHGHLLYFSPSNKPDVSSFWENFFVYYFV